MTLIRDYLEDLLKYIGHLEDFSREGRENFMQDVKTQFAVERSYEVIGEIVKRLPDTLLNQYPEIQWRNIKGFRDILSHRYDEIDLELVWQALKDLPNLRIAVKTMLNNLPDDEPDDR